MVTHSSILAWRIPRTKEPGRLQSMVFQRVGHDSRDFECMDRGSTASLSKWVPCWTAQPLRCLRVGQPGPEQPGKREDGRGGKDREVLGATVREQRGAGWEKGGGGREEIRVLIVQGQAIPSLSCPNSYGDRN